MKKWGKISVICLIVAIVSVCFPKKIKIVNSIRTFDGMYLTILADPRECRDEEKIRKKLYEMCIENTFEEIKVWTEDQPLPEKIYISVYTSQRNLRNGKSRYEFAYEEEGGK